MNTPLTITPLTRVGDEISARRDDRKVPFRPIPKDLRSESIRSWLDDLGPWLLFFFAIYVILMMKLITFHTLDDHLFFGAYSILVTTYILSRFLFSYFK